MTSELQLVLEFIASIFIFPGLLFSFTGALLNQWYMRKVIARMQNRIGPRYVGPFGILQPFYDFYKLFSKEDITPKYGKARLYSLFIGIGIGSNIAILMFLPISPFKFSSSFDVVIFAYLGIWSTVSLAFASLVFPNPFSSIGASRLLSLMLVYEPTWILSILTPITIISRHINAISFSILGTIENFSIITSNPVYVVLTIASFAAAVISLQCKLGLQPFDVFEADSEIIAGVYTEFSGAKLALSSLFHDVETFAGAILVTFLFLGGAFPLSLYTIEGVLLVLVKFLILVFLLTAIKASSARYRVDQATGFFFKYPLLLALAALIIAGFV
jgi:NADH-quinone oxidoreductase subunit H